MDLNDIIKDAFTDKKENEIFTSEQRKKLLLRILSDYLQERMPKNPMPSK